MKKDSLGYKYINPKWPWGGGTITPTNECTYHAYLIVFTGIYYVLIASVCFALFNLLTRKLKGQSDPWFTVFYQSLVGTVVLAVFVPSSWSTPTTDAWLLLGILIAAAIIGHWLVVRAFDYAPASFLAPFGYFEMISAVAIGYFWFDDFPDEFTWAGIAVIASA